MNLSELRKVLLNNPSKELLVEVIGSSNVPPALKATVFLGLQTMKPEQIAKFSKVAAIALQYVEQGNIDGLTDLCKRTGIPDPIITVIKSYASNITVEQ